MESFTLDLLQELKEKDLYTPELDKCITAFLRETLKQQLMLQNATKHSFTWGKYKGLEIASIYAIDKKYCRWIMKQEYLSRAHKAILEQLEASSQGLALGSKK